MSAALEVGGELAASDRPTIPVPEPRESGVRLQIARVAFGAATVDIVVCDLSRDPRSESYIAPRIPNESGSWPSQRPQNDSPPSTSTVLALK
jgi:hypothetical protein